MIEGKVKWFSDDKGYGFIEKDGKEIFVHYSSIILKGHKTLNNDDIVNFDVVETDKGLQAKNVRLVLKKVNM